MLNRCEFIGNLGSDPEIRNIPSGGKVVNLSIGVSEKWRDKSTGEQREKTEWVRCVIFNEGLAGVAEKYLRKGSKVYIAGSLQTRKWQDQSGADKYSTEVVLQNFNGHLVLLDGGGNREEQKQERRPSQASGAHAAAFAGLDDDIPFAPEFR